ncbi:hypothetical protein RUM43_007708 [Polyplax serrata]|uniref:Uncharacterized protein n=1 Tax=Polyplax serrata TaxID=468196 RepID=A0AAN8S5P8_POLSC
MEVHLWKERVYRHEMLRDERAQGLKGHTGQGHMVRPRDSDRTRIPLKSGCGLTCHGAFLMGHEADTCGVVKSSLDRGLPPSLTSPCAYRPIPEFLKEIVPCGRQIPRIKIPPKSGRGNTFEKRALLFLEE